MIKITEKVNVTLKDTMNENEIPYAVSQEGGVFLRLVWNDTICRGEFDREGSRYQVCVTKVMNFYNVPYYIVSAPNFYYSYEGTSVSRVAYQMCDKTDIAKVDAESVQMAAVYMKSLMDKYDIEVLDDQGRFQKCLDEAGELKYSVFSPELDNLTEQNISSILYKVLVEYDMVTENQPQFDHATEEDKDKWIKEAKAFFQRWRDYNSKDTEKTMYRNF